MQALLGSVAVGAAGLLAGCSGGAPSLSTGALPEPASPQRPPAGSSAPRREPATVALLLPLTGGGQTLLLAKAMRQAAELEIFARANEDVQLVVKDDKGTEVGARAAAEEALRAGAEIILGPLYARQVAAVAAVARPANVPVIAFSNDPTVAGPGVYLLSFLVEAEVNRVVAYAASQGRRRMVALVPGDTSGQLVEATFQQAARRAGVEVVALERYALTANGMAEPVRRVRDAIEAAATGNAPVDACFLPAGQDTLPQLASIMPQLGIDTAKVKLLGTGSWDYPNVERDTRLREAWFAAPDPRGWREFAERFAKAYGQMPPRIASLAFDAVGVAAALSSEPKGARYGAAQLTRATGFNGADGPFRLLPGGHVERSLAVLELKEFGAVAVDPAGSLPAPGGAAAALGSPPPAAPLRSLARLPAPAAE